MFVRFCFFVVLVGIKIRVAVICRATAEHVYLAYSEAFLEMRFLCPCSSRDANERCEFEIKN